MAKVGMTQEALADYIGKSSNTLSSRINGTSYFDTEEIDKICEALNITSEKEKVAIFLAVPSQKWDSEEKKCE